MLNINCINILVCCIKPYEAIVEWGLSSLFYEADKLIRILENQGLTLYRTLLAFQSQVHITFSVLTVCYYLL